ncbi:MAG: CHASE2 domain-containing protein [Akkermansiaceae bacterium]|nr:CHASE2 domain-containing protein [Verrucomicrobiales bacterium]
MLKRLINAGRFRRWAAGALTAVIAVALFQSPLRESWSNWSFDWLFLLRPHVDVSSSDVVIVEMDAESEAAFGQIPVLAWDRGLHAQLLQRLTAMHADVVVFDVLFQDSDKPTAADEAFLQAAQTHGRVLFGAVQLEKRSPAGERIGSQLLRPFASSLPLDQVGLVEESFSADRAIRRHFPGDERIPSLAMRAAELTMANPPRETATPRWVNYYGPPDETFPRVSYWRILSNALPATINFSNKVVFVGARTTIGPTAGSGTEYFPTPFGSRMTGVEVNATAYLNLYRNDWLARAPERLEFWCLALIGALAGSRLCGMSAKQAALAAALTAAATVLVAVFFFWQMQFWFPWLFIVGAVLPVGFVASRLVHPIKPLETLAVKESAAATVLPAASGVEVPDHTMLRCIGRGAYGEVWLARDAIGSFHAVKLVFRKSFSSAVPFEREFRGMQKYTPISRNHPGWVHVLHVGRNEAQGCFYYIMEAGDDESSGQEINPNTYQPRSLASEILKRRRLPPRECLDIGVALADALDYLHGQLLVHRDIKPSNVIFVHGQPKFTDVGLVTEVSNRDRDVSCLGTEGYMAPEGPGTAVADIYSLGKLLYEASTGRDRKAFPEVPESMVEGEQPELQRCLRAVILKACQQEPQSRYASAAEMRDELMKLQRD